MAWDGTLVGTYAAHEAAGYGRLVAALRDLQDALASARFDPGEAAALTTELAAWTERLAPLRGEEQESPYGRVAALPVRGRAVVPELRVTARPSGRTEGVVRFGRWFLGAGDAVHGGAVSLLFDDLLGVTAEPLHRGGLNRTASLRVDYRALTPIDRDLDAVAWIDSIEGRKVVVRGRLQLGDTVCAEAEALLIRLRPDQGRGRIA